MSDEYTFDIIRRLDRLERVVGALTTQDQSPIKYREASTSGAPTNAELDTAFGTAGATPAEDGFVGVFLDTAFNGSYVVWVANGTWYYDSGTIAA